MNSIVEKYNYLNCLYADAVDNKDFESWIDFFLPDSKYLVQSRENHDRGLPLALINLSSQNMLRDRIYGVTDTIFHQPYYMRHVIGAGILEHTDNTVNPKVYTMRANYAVFRTKPRGRTEVFNVGYYKDKIVEQDNKLKILERRCVYDSELVLNALIYPI